MTNLFEILNLPVAFPLNLKTLERAYFDAQRQWHPDRFVGKPEEERAEAAHRSVLINDAYETLKNPLERARHMLEIHGIFIDDETQPPAPLLMEMIELREHIHDHADDGRALLASVDELKAGMQSTSDAITEAFANGDMEDAQTHVLRFGYLGKALEEAHMLLYRYKASHGVDHAH